MANEFNMAAFEEELKTMGKEGIDVRDFRNSIILEPQPFPTFIVAYAVHKNPTNNNIKSIKGRRGVPIGGYSYHVVEDSYDIRCVDMVNLGEIGLSLMMTLPGVSQWHIYVPLPDNIIKRYLNAKQHLELKNFTEKYKDNHFIEYFQMISHS